MIFGIVDALGQLRSRNIGLCRSFGDRATGLPHPAARCCASSPTAIRVAALASRARLAMA